MIDPPPASPAQPEAGPDSAPPSSPPPAIDPKTLTPEEQMARFEQELKETDWGHQPC